VTNPARGIHVEEFRERDAWEAAIADARRAAESES
jgi:hypothetical protein